MTSSPSLYTRILCTVGIILSLYALYVEHKTHHSTDEHGISDRENEEFQEEFKALCDIEAIGASCR